MSIKSIKIGAVEYLAADGIEAVHGFTTRFGGVSEGYLASMNIVFSRGDIRENVLENYRILGEALQKRNRPDLPVPDHKKRCIL
jgi:hypothetical protein